jgi:hypothetical protein
MKKMSFNKWHKAILLLVIIISLIFFTAGNWDQVLAQMKFKTSTSQLYANANSQARNGRYLWAAFYLFAYIQRDPTNYVNNVGNHQKYVNNKLNEYISGISYREKGLQRFYDAVQKDMRSCGCYPCQRCKKVSEVSVEAYQLGSPPSVEPLQPPPDMAVVCVDPDYQGQCVYLPAGVYNGAENIGLPNDSISSVMVGSRVTLTLCLHGRLTGNCITFTGNDDDLSNNPVPGGYKWDNNATSAKVTLR